VPREAEKTVDRWHPMYLPSTRSEFAVFDVHERRVGASELA